MTIEHKISSQLFVAQAYGLMPYFKHAARRWNIPVQILLAVASRETGIGTDSYYLSHGFTGKDGHGKGIMQVDDRYHKFALITAPNDHEKMIDYGAHFLSQLRDQFGNMKDALSAYNAGPDDVEYAKARGIDPDLYTTAGNYAADVLQRAKIIKEQLGLGVSKSLVPAALVLFGGGGMLYYEWKSGNMKLKTI